jgi:hypothetical protein
MTYKGQVYSSSLFEPSEQDGELLATWSGLFTLWTRDLAPFRQEVEWAPDLIWTQLRRAKSPLTSGI